MPEPLAIASDVCRSYRAGRTSFDVLRAVSCAVTAGQRIGLTGPSGSGKSTLLHLLGGLDVPTRGSVEWPGLGPRNSLRPGRVVDIFQGPSLLPPLSVVENVKLPQLLMGVPDKTAEMRALEMLERFDLAHLHDRLPDEISGGQSQRISIARALAVKPTLILADEPTGQLDSKTAETVLRTLLSIASEAGSAIVVSTHDPRVACMMEVAWTLDNGRLFVDRPIEEQPAFAEVAAAHSPARLR